MFGRNTIPKYSFFSSPSSFPLRGGKNAPKLGLALLLSMLWLSGELSAQTAASVYPQAWQAFNGSRPVNSITLTADANLIAGSDNETGTAQLTANADGSYNIQLSLSVGARSEVQTSFSTGQQGTWSGQDGITHTTAFQNSQLPIAWFMPSVALFGGQQPSTVMTGMPSGNYLSQNNTAAANPDPAITALYAHVSSISIAYDPKTNLPTTLSYAIHPDNSATQDVPVQVQYLSYQAINGAMIPFEIKQYVNGVLSLNLDVTQASVN